MERDVALKINRYRELFKAGRSEIKLRKQYVKGSQHERVLDLLDNMLRVLNVQLDSFESNPSHFQNWFVRMADAWISFTGEQLADEDELTRSQLQEVSIAGKNPNALVDAMTQRQDELKALKEEGFAVLTQISIVRDQTTERNVLDELVDAYEANVYVVLDFMEDAYHFFLPVQGIEGGPVLRYLTETHDIALNDVRNFLLSMKDALSMVVIKKAA